MKEGLAVLVRDRMAQSHRLRRNLGNVVEWAKKQQADFFYFVDCNRDARNFDAYEKIAAFAPFIVETESAALVERLNEIEAPVVSKHWEKARNACALISDVAYFPSKFVYAVVKRAPTPEERKRIGNAKVIAFVRLPAYAVVKRV